MVFFPALLCGDVCSQGLRVSKAAPAPFFLPEQRWWTDATIAVVTGEKPQVAVVAVQTAQPCGCI